MSKERSPRSVRATNYTEIMRILENSGKFFDGRIPKLDPDVFGDDWEKFKKMRKARFKEFAQKAKQNETPSNSRDGTT